MGSEAGPSMIEPPAPIVPGNNPISSDEDDYIDSPHEHTDDEYEGSGKVTFVYHLWAGSKK